MAREEEKVASTVSPLGASAAASLLNPHALLEDQGGRWRRCRKLHVHRDGFAQLQQLCMLRRTRGAEAELANQKNCFQGKLEPCSPAVHAKHRDSEEQGASVLQLKIFQGK